MGEIEAKSLSSLDKFDIDSLVHILLVLIALNVMMYLLKRDGDRNNKGALSPNIIFSIIRNTIIITSPLLFYAVLLTFLVSEVLICYPALYFMFTGLLIVGVFGLIEKNKTMKLLEYRGAEKKNNVKFTYIVLQVCFVVIIPICFTVIWSNYYDIPNSSIMLRPFSIIPSNLETLLRFNPNAFACRDLKDNWYNLVFSSKFVLDIRDLFFYQIFYSPLAVVVAYIMNRTTKNYFGQISDKLWKID